MTEAELLREVLALASRLALLWHHCPDSRRCAGQSGFPDVVLSGPRGLLFRELKDERNDTSAGQDLWGWTMMHHPWPGGPPRWAVWRPEHLADGTIEREMRAIA